MRQHDMENEDLTGKKIATLLDAGTEQLDAQVQNCLADARQQAVNVLARRELLVAQGNHGITEVFSAYFHQHRMWVSLGLLLGSLLIAFTVSQQLTETSRDGDAFLLAAELPPEAFLDQGFVAWAEQN